MDLSIFENNEILFKKTLNFNIEVVINNAGYGV